MLEADPKPLIYFVVGLTFFAAGRNSDRSAVFGVTVNIREDPEFTNRARLRCSWRPRLFRRPRDESASAAAEPAALDAYPCHRRKSLPAPSVPESSAAVSPGH